MDQIDLAYVDDLTGLYNRRGFVAVATERLAEAGRRGSPLFVLFADMDGMKSINDTLGHREGDRALVDAARLLADTVRANDVAARVGGDEFCVLLDAGEESADKVVLRLHRQVELFNAADARPYRIRLSVGAAGFDPAEPATIEDLIAHADRGMYEDKARLDERPCALVIEDDPVHRRLAIHLLEGRFEVLTAATGEDGFSAAVARRPSVIVLDLHLPDGPGTAVAARLRAEPRTRAIPIVMLTASREDEAACLRSGVDDFVAKPIDEDVLLLRMAKLLRRR